MQPAARGPFCHDGHRARLQDTDQVIEYLVGDVFVKDATVAEGLEVELVRFEFDAGSVGDVGEADGAVVGLAGFGANRSELRGDVLDFVVAFGVGVGEGIDGGVGHGGSPEF